MVAGGAVFSVRGDTCHIYTWHGAWCAVKAHIPHVAQNPWEMLCSALLKAVRLPQIRSRENDLQKVTILGQQQ